MTIINQSSSCMNKPRDQVKFAGQMYKERNYTVPCSAAEKKTNKNKTHFCAHFYTVLTTKTCDTGPTGNGKTG